MRQLILYKLIFLLVVTCAGAEPVPLVALLPLTGSAAEQGEWIQRGLELALSDVDKNMIHLQVEDTGADPRSALSIYRRLRMLSKFPVVFTYGSGVGLVLTPLVNRDSVVQFGLATSSSAYRTADDYTFRNFPDTKIEAEFIANMLLNRFEVRETAVIYIQNEYGVSAAEEFKQAFISSGGNVVAEESFQPGEIDYRGILLRIKSRNPKFVYFAAYPGEGALMLKQAKQIGFETRWIASAAVTGSRKFLGLAGDAAEGLLVATSTPIFAGNKQPEVKEFAEKYQERYGEMPGVQHGYAVRAYDAMRLVTEAIKECKSAEASCIRDYLFSVRGYHGASGTLDFDRAGDISASFTLQTIKSGDFILFDQ